MDSLHPIIRVVDEAYLIPQLNRTRRITALLPYDYDTSGKHYPVLYLLDGQNLYSKDAPYGSWEIAKSLEKLAETGNHEIIIIAIDHADEERVMEYSPYYNPKFGNGQGDLFLRFLLETLIPEVETRFRVSPGRENRGIGGSSMGGLLSLYAGIRNPEMFGKLMIFSPSLWISPKLYYHTSKFVARMPMHIYVYAGEKESKNHIANVRRLKESLFRTDADTSQLTFQLSIHPEGTHSEVYWGMEFPKALKWLFF